MAILARPINDRNAHLRDYFPKVTQCLPTAGPLPPWLSGGRSWWAHLEFTRINIEPTILRKKFEDLREAGATFVTLRHSMRIVVRPGVGDDFRNWLMRSR